MADNFVDMIHGPIVNLIVDDDELKMLLKEKFPYTLFDVTHTDFIFEMEDESFREWNDLIIVEKSWQNNDSIPQNIQQLLKNYPEKTHLVLPGVELSEIEQLVRKVSDEEKRYLYESKKMTLEEWKKYILCYVYFINKIVTVLKNTPLDRHQNVRNSIVNGLEDSIHNTLTILSGGGINTVCEAMKLLKDLVKRNQKDLIRLHIFGLDADTMDLSWVWHDFYNNLGGLAKHRIRKVCRAEGIDLDDEEPLR